MAIDNFVDTRHMRRYVDKIVNKINTMIVGIVVKIDNEKMLYDVQPILREYDPSGVYVDRAILVRCPLSFQKCGGFFMRMPYEVGDMVYVGICQESIDESLEGSSVKDNRTSGVRKFRIVDGVVLGGIMNYTETTSSDNLSDFVIQNRRNDDKLIMKLSGGFEIITGNNVQVNADNVVVDANKAVINCPTDINGDVLINGNLTVSGNANVSGSGMLGSVNTKKGTSLDNHTHMYNPGGNPPTQTGGAE